METHVVSVACLVHRQKALQERQICLHVNVKTGASCGLNKHYSLTGNSSLEGIPDQRAPFEGLISQKESVCGSVNGAHFSFFLFFFFFFLVFRYRVSL